MSKLLSVKELRLNFPKVRRGLAKGERYTLLYRSTPVGVLAPMPDVQDAKDVYAFFANPPKRFLFRAKKSAVRLVREERVR